MSLTDTSNSFWGFLKLLFLNLIIWQYFCSADYKNKMSWQDFSIFFTKNTVLIDYNFMFFCYSLNFHYVLSSLYSILYLLRRSKLLPGFVKNTVFRTHTSTFSCHLASTKSLWVWHNWGCLVRGREGNWDCLVGGRGGWGEVLSLCTTRTIERGRYWSLLTGN